MQNAIIKYKIRLDAPPHTGKEIEMELKLSDIEYDNTLEGYVFSKYYPDSSGWAINYYTVIERTIEPFNED